MEVGLGPMLTGILLKRSEYLKTWNARQITLIPRCNGNAAFLFWRARQRKCYFLLDEGSSASLVGEVLVLKNAERSVWFRSSVGELPIREWLDAIETARVLVDVASAFATRIPSFVPFEVPFDLSYVIDDVPLQLVTPGIVVEDPVQDRSARAPLQQTELSENIAATPLRPQSAQGGVKCATGTRARPRENECSELLVFRPDVEGAAVLIQQRARSGLHGLGVALGGALRDARVDAQGPEPPTQPKPVTRLRHMD